MPAFPNKAKVANKQAAFQMLMAVALECEYFNYCVDLTIEEISTGKECETLTRADWLSDYTRGEEIEFCQCDDCEGLTEHNEEETCYLDNYPPLKEGESEHDYYHATI